MDTHPRDLANAIAHTPTEVEELGASGRVDLTQCFLDADGRRVNVYTALHTAALWLAQGKRDIAESLANECITAITDAVLPIAEAELAHESEPTIEEADIAPPPPKPNPNSPALWGFVL